MVDLIDSPGWKKATLNSIVNDNKCCKDAVTVTVPRQYWKISRKKYQRLGENTEKNITFSLTIENTKNGKTMTCKQKLVDRFIHV